MHLSITSALVAVGGATAASAYTVGSTVQTDLLAAQALANQTAYHQQHGGSTACTVQTPLGSLSGAERIAYTNAVKCLMAKPALLDPVEFPGSRTRYDDFVAVHVAQTFEIHSTASFLSWHWYFTWAYEQALRKECGYNGYQPYWNWGKDAHDPLNSPIFDGGATSMPGNGEFYPHNCTGALPTGERDCIPPGNSGGCVTSGPFADMVVNLGPIGPSLAVDNNPFSQWSTDAETYDLLEGGGYSDILSFQNHMQGDFPNGYFGVHSTGHYTIGGDPGGDFFTSPGDPSFWLYHGQIDRVWWIWQNLYPANRTVAVAGGMSLLDPAGPQGTLEDPVNVSPSEDIITILNAMSTLGREGSPFCYIYA
ncbi:putative tyrosinase [Podospora australis]|uniref:Tyrosinase n=1 Tax=Podospora australis TaxID=1536484 RepID=A0AAN7ADJ0_9PEZI|nr:putative tyrosinase [Podospora australis]